ncbi:MAG: PEP-CTERM sorting domain-containing protein [Armatimonadota bacterium]|nr:PEP-CTERM sorting domain-containing protein [bacterium]
MRRPHLLVFVSTAVACLGVLLVSCASAATYTFSLSGVLGRHNYPLYGSSYTLDTKVRFNRIDSITVQVKGTSSFAGYDGSLVPYSIGINFGAPFHGYPNYGGSVWEGGLTGESQFDACFTFPRGASWVPDQFLDDMNAGVIHYSIYLYSSSDGLGWCTPESATYSVTGETVPEPSSVLALFTGLVGLGSIAIRRRR